MTIELIGSVLFFILTVFSLLFSLTRSSQVDGESFPNRGRFYTGLIIWVIAAILAVFMSFPGYAEWFVPTVYPILKVAFAMSFLAGFFMVLTTLIAFPQHMSYYRREIDGRSDRIALLENIRQIVSQPYPVTELFSLVLKELGSFLVIQKGAVFMTNPSRREMYLVSQIGLDKDELARMERFPMGRDIISLAASEQTPQVSGDLATSDSASRKLILAGRELTLSAAALPLSSRDRSLGALLVISDKPYRFQKRDRMLLTAAAEAVADVIEANRLARDNQKLTRQAEESIGQLESLRNVLQAIAGNSDYKKALTTICRELVDKYHVLASRVIKVVDGELIDIARHESGPETANRNESYVTAVINAIRRKKMVILNQEARGREGETYISRTALLCPITLRTPGEYALLLEAHGNGLPLNDSFLSDIEAVLNMVAMALNTSGFKEVENLNQTAVKALLRILKIKPDEPRPEVFKHFLAEIGRLLAAGFSALVFIRDRENQYGILDSGSGVPVDLNETVFLPGEGPVGKAAITGESLEFIGRTQMEEGWKGLDQVNQDFLNYLGGENQAPDYHLSIPIMVLDEVVAVLAIFGHLDNSRPAGREKAMLLLAAQLLSIRMSMASMDKSQSESIGRLVIPDAGETINNINNNLATVIGQAELLERQSEISGQARFIAGEILKAAEQAASSIKLIQDRLAAGEGAPAIREDAVIGRLDGFLMQHHVTGDLYMFDNNRAVTLHKELEEAYPSTSGGEQISSFLESVLRYFVTLQEEGDEVLVKSQIKDRYFYLSLVRGNRERYREFDPAIHDFGAPDVLPPDLANDKIVHALANNRGEVSFDRFGRRPTYLSFRFPCSDEAVPKSVTNRGSEVAGLRILAIDDQQMILDLLAGICQSLNLELTAFRDPARGVEVFKQQRFDIAMVDLAIGQVSGWDIAREIKRQAPGTPVIMMTGWGINIDPEKAARGGVDFTLTKPFKIEQLTEIITKAKIKIVTS